MTWVGIDETLFEHRKTRRLKTHLRVDVYRVVGHLTKLWAWGMRTTGRDGVLKADVRPEDIAFGAGWAERDAPRFVAALVEVVFLEYDGEVYRFHDWETHAKPYYDSRDNAAESASTSGTYGNHKKWHLNRGIFKENCAHCLSERDPAKREMKPQLPLGPTLVPDIASNRPDIASESLPTQLTPTRSDRSTGSTRDMLRFKLQLLPGEMSTLQREFPNVDVGRRFSEWVDWVLEEEKKRSPRRGNFAAFKGFLKADNGLQVAGGGR